MPISPPMVPVMYIMASSRERQIPFLSSSAAIRKTIISEHSSSGRCSIFR